MHRVRIERRIFLHESATTPSDGTKAWGIAGGAPRDYLGGKAQPAARGARAWRPLWLRCGRVRRAASSASSASTEFGGHGEEEKPRRHSLLTRLLRRCCSLLSGGAEQQEGTSRVRQVSETRTQAEVMDDSRCSAGGTIGWGQRERHCTREAMKRSEADLRI